MSWKAGLWFSPSAALWSLRWDGFMQPYTRRIIDHFLGFLDSLPGRAKPSEKSRLCADGKSPFSARAIAGLVPLDEVRPMSGNIAVCAPPVAPPHEALAQTAFDQRLVRLRKKSKLTLFISCRMAVRDPAYGASILWCARGGASAPLCRFHEALSGSSSGYACSLLCGGCCGARRSSGKGSRATSRTSPATSVAVVGRGRHGRP